MTRERGAPKGAPHGSAATDDQPKSTRPLLFAWQHAIRESDLDPTTKLVAFTVSTYMNIDGSSAHPGAELLAKNTGLSERTVRRHLGVLTERGWLDVVRRGGRFQGATEYRATLRQQVTSDRLKTSQPVTRRESTGHWSASQPVTGDTPPAQDQLKQQQQQENDVEEVTAALAALHGMTGSRALTDATGAKLTAGWTPAGILEHPMLRAPITGAHHPASALAARFRDLGDPPPDPREQEIRSAFANGRAWRGIAGAADALHAEHGHDAELLKAALDGLEALDTEEVAT